MGPGMAPRMTIMFSSGSTLNDVEVLNGDLIYAHVACADLALEDAAGVGAGAHGACVTVNRTAAVGGGGALCAVALDNAGVALALAGAGDVDLVAGCEDVCLQNVADVELCRVFELELFKVLEHADAGLLQMAGFGLVSCASRKLLRKPSWTAS